MAVQFKFTGDDKDVQRALERMEKQYNALIATTKKGTDETKKHAAAAKKAYEDTRTPLEQWARKMQELNALVKEGAISQETFGRAAKKASDELNKTSTPAAGLVKAAMSAASGYVSVAAALAAVNTQLQRKNELEKKSSDKQMEFANLRRESLINLGNAPAAERKEIFAGLRKISETRGVSPTVLEGALPEASSAQGNLSPQALIASIDMAARIAPHSPDTLRTLAGGLQDTASLTGSDDMMSNMGFQLGIGRRTRVKSLADINEYMIPGAIGVKGFGGTAPEAAAWVSTFTSAMKDSSGRVGSHAAPSLARQLDEFMPVEDLMGPKDAHGRQKLLRKGMGVMTPDEKVAYMQTHPELRKEFLAQGSWETRAFIPTRDFLTAGTEMDKLHALNKSEIKDGTPGANAAAAFIADIKANPMQQDADSERAVDATVERMELDDAEGARNANARNKMLKALNKSGQWFGANWQAMATFDLSGADPEDAAIGQLEQRKKDIQWWPGESARDTRRIAGIDEVIAELKKISGQQRNRDPKQHAE